MRACALCGVICNCCVQGPLPPTHATALSQTPQAPHVGAAHSHTPNHGLALARRVAPNAAHRTATTVSTTHASPRYPGAPGPSKGLQLSGGTSQSHGGGIGNLQVITAPHPSVAAKQNQRAQAQPQTHGHGFGRLRVQPPSETLKSIQVSNSRLSGGGRGGMWPTTQKSTVSSELPPPRAAHAVHASFPSASGSGVGGKKSQGALLLCGAVCCSFGWGEGGAFVLSHEWTCVVRCAACACAIRAGGYSGLRMMH